MTEPAILITGLRKRYRLGVSTGQYKTLRDSLARLLLRQGRSGAPPQWLWALDGVDLEVPAGQVLGIIGRNGAGKSTLLKMLAAITDPTAGRIEIRGRVASLLEIGTGFHGELTGRENIYLNGAILGMTRAEIRARFDAIVAFSEIEGFLDTPVKRYSSGMYVRLAFAVAAHLDPDILIVDEVLAVGDLAFQRKCLGRMGEAARGGRTVLFVSHNMGMVQALCDRAILLEAGRVGADGPPASVIQQYVDRVLGANPEDATLQFQEEPELPFQVLALRLSDTAGRVRTYFDLFDQAQLRIDYVIRESVPGTHLQLSVMHQGEILLLSWDTDKNPDGMESRAPGRYAATVRLPAPLLKAGHYQIRVGMGVARSRAVHNPEASLTLSLVEASVGTNLLAYAADRPGRLVVPLEWRTEPGPPG